MLVCSSWHEGLSTVIVEGLILGKAIVTTACAGMDELLGNSEFGVITENNEEALCKGIKMFLYKPEIIKEFSEKAKLKGESLKKNGTLETTEHFFENLLV